MNITIKKLSIILFILTSFCAQAEDWPMYMRDASRSGNTPAEIGSKLYLQWEYSPRNLPAPAWPAPAKTDYWHREEGLKPRVIYDRANHTVTFGNNIYFGSSADDKVYCLDTKTGKEKWTFFTGGPVRLAPTIYKGLIYFGSDDGCVYCLDAKSGKLKWKKDAVSSRFLPGNERMISATPVRTGVLIYNGIAYFSSGIFPREGVTISAVKALTGEVVWENSNSGISPQGYMLATESELFIPTGRTTPVVFSRITGKKKGQFEGNGGAYAILSNNDLIYGAGDLGTLEYSSHIKNKIATFNGEQMLVSGNVSFLRTANEITAISRSDYIDNYNDWAKVSETRSNLADDVWDLREQRKVALSLNKDVSAIDKKIEKLLSKIENTDTKQKSIEKGGTIWKKTITDIYSMIIAGNSLITGGNGKITVVDSKNGNITWENKVEGNIYGLAVADGNLYASTDKGNIYCFNSTANSKANKISAIKGNPFSTNKIADQVEGIAKDILKNTGITKGYCLVVGAGEGLLISELAKNSELQIIGIVSDDKKLATARRNLDKVGLYGSRVTLHKYLGSNLPYTKSFANLVVLGDEYLSKTPKLSTDELLKMLRPFGGTAYLGGKNMSSTALQNWVDKSAKSEWEVSNINGAWATFKKGSEPGFGEWTHQYADAGNSSSSMDQLQGEMQIQWFGRPGPRKMINRHSRSVSPLVKDGRLFVPADNRIITVDAFNGTVLWEKEVPGSRVLGALKDFGNRVVTDDIMYIAANNECIGFDVESGDERVRFDAPQPFPLNKHDWGYLATTGKQLFGTGKKAGSTFTILGRINCDDFEGDFREMVTADYLFSLDRHTGKELWTYQEGVVFNNTITIGNESIYFVESRNTKAFADFDGRMQIDHFCESETYIVKLNAQTGEKEWEKAYHFPFEQIMYLTFSENILLVTGSYNVKKNVHYGLYAFNGDSGKEIWTNSYKGQETGGSHGEQWQHPVIIDGTIFNFPLMFDLHTGKKGSKILSKGGCGGFSGSANNLFARKSNPTMFSIDEGNRDETHLTEVNRPGCWINIIPASGLISVPESSSGCTCDYPIQTSFVFIPKN